MNKDHYKPGSLGCHEALHTTSVLLDLVQRALIEHPAIEANDEWNSLANSAAAKLGVLYQKIAVAHLSDGDTDV